SCAAQTVLPGDDLKPSSKDAGFSQVRQVFRWIQRSLSFLSGFPSAGILVSMNPGSLAPRAAKPKYYIPGEDMPRVEVQPAMVFFRRAALLFALGILCLQAIVPRAQAGDLSTAVKLSIPGQPLESALRALANQADIEIMFSSK